MSDFKRFRLYNLLWYYKYVHLVVKNKIKWRINKGFGKIVQLTARHELLLQRDTKEGSGLISPALSQN